MGESLIRKEANIRRRQPVISLGSGSAPKGSEADSGITVLLRRYSFPRALRVCGLLYNA